MIKYSKLKFYVFDSFPSATISFEFRRNYPLMPSKGIKNIIQRI